jgi:hypothetical protein
MPRASYCGVCRVLSFYLIIHYMCSGFYIGGFLDHLLLSEKTGYCFDFGWVEVSALDRCVVMLTSS